MRSFALPRCFFGRRRGLQPEGSVSGIKDVRGHRISGFVRVTTRQSINDDEVFPHCRNHKGFIEPRSFLPEDPQLEQINPVGRRDDGIAEKVDQSVVQIPIYVLRLRDQIRV